MNHFSRYRDIIFYRTLAGLKSEARKNYLGYLWFVLEPVLTTALLYFVMANATGRRGPEVVFALLIGMITWQWFESSVMLSSASITAKFHVHQQVPLPKYLFPMVDVCTNTIKFSVAFILVCAASLIVNAGPAPALAWLPVILVIQFALICGMALTVSIVVTLIQDLRVPLSTFFRLLFFASGIFFTAEKIPGHLLPYFYANPMAVLIEAYRDVILHQHMPHLGRLGLTSVTAAVLLFAGYALHAYFDKRLLKLTNV